MSEGVQQKIERRVEKAILQLMAYYAVLGMPLREAEVNQLISAKTGHLAVRGALHDLVDAETIVQDTDGCYRLTQGTYHDRSAMEERQQKLLAKARHWAKVMGLLPFVKAVVVVDSVAVGNVQASSNIDLLIVTKPNRIFLTKGILMNVLKWLMQLQNGQHKAGRFNISMFITTAGLNWQRDIMAVNEPCLVYWLMASRPVYGAPIWYDLLKSSSYIQERVPNYIWPKSDIRVYSNGLEQLDALDNKGYRMHLRHTAAQPHMHTEQSFVRLRPDIINLHAIDQSSKITQQYKRIYKSVDKVV